MNAFVRSLTINNRSQTSFSLAPVAGRSCLKNIMKLSMFFSLIAFGFCTAIFSCNTPSAEKAFDVAVLNSNMIIGFANNGMERDLESPSIKMGITKDEMISMTRKEVLENKLKFVEENYYKLKGFTQTDDTKNIIQMSLALHELILPVYKNEYAHLAKLYDSNASKNEIEELKKSIHDQYFLKFETLYNQLISSGKLYAKEHNIEVRWAM